MATVIDRHEVQKLVRQDAQLVDVLGAKEYEAEHIPGAINLPLKNLDGETAKRLDARRPVITYCHDYQWDMSARAASRLAILDFPTVYRYQAGKADWFAAGLPREGRDALVPRVADVAQRDVPTCGPREPAGRLQERLRALGGDVCVVLDADRVVLGLLDREALVGDPATPVENVMKRDPVTFRPHLRAGEIPEYVGSRQARYALVTTSDGVLIGLLPPMW
jgi:rhodanese-related sulfurtransferase